MVSIGDEQSTQHLTLSPGTTTTNHPHLPLQDDESNSPTTKVNNWDTEGQSRRQRLYSSREPHFQGIRSTQILAAVAANMGALAFGSVMSWTATALPDIRVDPVFVNGVSTDDESWIGAVVPLGAALAGPIAGFGVERFGRKMSMLILTVPFVLGWLLIFLANNIGEILIGRFITGLCGGAFAIAAPIFVGEIADAEIRGTLAAGFELMITFGMLYIYMVGNYVKWRAQAFICGIVPVLIFLLLLIIPESPRYLLGKGKFDKAAKSLKWYRGATTTDDIMEELNMLKKAQEEHDHSQHNSNNNSNCVRSSCFSCLDLIKFPTIIPVSIVLFLFIFQELSAIDAVCFYTVDIFQSAGVSFDSYYSTIIVGVVQIVASAFASLFVDRFGRRFFLLISEIFMTISLGSFGIFFFMKEHHPEFTKSYLEWLPLICLVTYIIAYSVGLGPVGYMILGEILPKSVKGLASSILTALKWLLGFAVTRYFVQLVELIGEAWNYWLFTGICFIGTIYIYFFVPETKGKTLEEIQDLFKHGSSSMAEDDETDDDTEAFLLNSRTPTPHGGGTISERKNYGATSTTTAGAAAAGKNQIPDFP